MNRRDYFKKRDSIMERWNKGDISLAKRNYLLYDLSSKFRIEWGNVLFENTYTREVR